MKRTLTIFVFTIALWGCVGSGAGSNASTINAPKVISTPLGKAVDLPGLADKSPDEIRNILGIAPKHETPYLVFVLPQGELTFYHENGKQITASFDLTGPDGYTGLDSIEKLGDLVGIDVHGKPVPSPSYRGYYRYNNLSVNGRILKQVSFSGVGGRFNHVAIHAVPDEDD